MTPAVADARALGNRVQGISSRLGDLTLHDGRRLSVLIGSAITRTPSLTRTMSGSSSVSVPVYDPDLKLLDADVMAERFTAEIDGLWFSSLGLKKKGKALRLTLEDREVAALRKLKGPKKVFAHRGQPNEVTRAEFIVGLVEEARPRIPIYCPQLHEKQPIKTERQGKQAKEDAKANRTGGIGDAKGLKVKGHDATKAQLELGDRALRVAESVKAPYAVQVALIAALIDESVMGEESSNVLQALGPGGAPIGSAEEEISGFLTGKPRWTETSAIEFYKSHPTAAPETIATNVQKNRDGASSYAPFVDEARDWVDEYTGGGLTEGAAEEVEAFSFEVDEKESYWDAIQRLAKEVNWRAFVVAGRFFYVDEVELSRGMVRLAIEREPGEYKPSTRGIIDVDFDVNGNKPVTEITITAYVDQWDVPPGAVVTLAGYGPASVGFGDAPVKANAKGQKQGLSSNRNARTGEGRGRYLVSSISVPLEDADDTDARIATIQLTRPTVPLPEPANNRSTAATGSSAGGDPAAVAKMIAECDRIDAKHYPYSSPGARGTPPPASGPYDCSGCVSRVVYVGTGEPNSTLASQELSEAFEPGEGEWLTVYAKGPNGPTGHTFLGIKTPSGWRKFGTSGTNPGGGAGWIDDSAFDAGYLGEFQKRHPKGL